MTLENGDAAPEFELPLLVAEEMGEVSLEDQSALSGPIMWSLREALAKGPVLLVFVKRSCPTCRWVLPLVEQIYRNYGNRKASVVVIAQEDESEVKCLRRDLRLKVPILLDRDYQVSTATGSAGPFRWETWQKIKFQVSTATGSAGSFRWET